MLQFYEIRRVRRAQFFLAIAIAAAVPFLFTTSASAAEPKRVLIINSFGSAAPPLTIHSTSFESELVARVTEGVALDEVSLDLARNDEPEMQEAMVDYLEKRQAKWKPDLVVAIASPALAFVAKHSERLFPNTPILGVAANQRFMPRGEWEKNAAYVGHEIDVPGFIEDMLQVAPATKNIEIVLGATSLDQAWREALQKAAEPLAGRIRFTYYNDLSYSQMLERVSTLPPDSYIFFLLLLRDVEGVTLKSDEALRRLHQVANAPMNGIFDHQLGTGIVGGRLLDGDRLGKEAATVAIRILHGEPPSSIPPVLLKRLPPRYDWHELKRWNISEKLLPAGSTVLYRTPSLWEQHRRLILSVITVGVLQALLISGLVVNLFRRRRAESSLGESEKRFQAVADATPVLIWVADEDNLGTYVNKAWVEFTGRSMEQNLGDRWSESVHPDDREKSLQTYSTAFDARERFVMQYRLRRHDGEYRWITAQGVPRYGRSGNFRGYVGACVDITDMLKKEAALREIEERVALAAEAAQLGVWELDLATNGVWVSDKARSLLQLDGDTLAYEDFQARVHPDDRAVRDAIKKAIATKSEYDSEYRVSLRDGAIRWISERARCLADDKGELTRLLGVSIDVTKRKQAEELFYLATEASPSGTVLVDEKGRIILVNAHIEELFGYQREELINQQIEILVPNHFWSAHPALLVHALARPQTREVATGWEVFARRKDGSEFPVEVGLNPIETPQGLLVLASVVNISARKAAEEEARQRREQVELLSRASLLGEMTASLAHELNQPLSAIVNNASAAMQYMERGNLQPGQVGDILTDIVSDAGRAHDIIHNVRSAIKKGSAIRGRINLNDVVKTISHLVLPDAAGHFCKLDLSLAESLPSIEGDPTQIQQVLINLVRNAFDAMHETPPPRRTVQITTSSNGDGTVCVAVRDHGTGLSGVTRDRLFEQFFTTKEEGLGMGLAIVRSIVEAHGGRIAAENVDGGGACFSFHLPASKGVEE